MNVIGEPIDHKGEFSKKPLKKISLIDIVKYFLSIP